MRITNKIIQNNQLSNINVNKNLQDKLSTQISSGKNIARPSDDPIVALRSLRLRTNVSQTTQYVDKNVEDGKSWLKVTEDAITTLTGIITDVRQQYTKATSDTLTPSDRRIIMENLTSLAAEIYNTGNVDFAGRSVFTGFRTSEPLTFQKNEDVSFDITETTETLTIDKKNLVYQEPLAAGATVDETLIHETDISRIRLSYKNLSEDVPTITYESAPGVRTALPVNITMVNFNDDPYTQIANMKDTDEEIIYVPETGELLFSKGAEQYLELDGIKVEYTKDKWNAGDLKPEHYFDCKDTTNDIEYSSHGGEIEYNVGVNQTLRVNTVADECFTHNISRDIDDALYALSRVDEIEEKVKSLTAELKAEVNPTNQAAIQVKLDAAKKEQTYLKNNLHTTLSKTITKADGYLDDANLALTDCGTRSKRLELIENRLDTQLSTLNELKSQNEDVDIAETAIRLASAKYSYDAALMAASKILKENLLNYI